MQRLWTLLKAWVKERITPAGPHGELPEWSDYLAIISKDPEENSPPPMWQLRSHSGKIHLIRRNEYKTICGALDYREGSYTAEKPDCRNCLRAA